MRLRSFAVLLSVLAPQVPAVRGLENNVWPFWVSEYKNAPGYPQESWSALDPLIFSQPFPSSSSGVQSGTGIRPLFLKRVDPAAQESQLDVLYPFLTYRTWGDSYRLSIFSVVNYQSPTRSSKNSSDAEKNFDVWPFYFSKSSGSPETSYHAVFPLYGSIRYRFGSDRLSWVLFPLYGRFEKRGVTTTTAPFPFIKVLKGDGNHGFAFWPLFGYREKEGAYREQFYLWPFFFKNEAALWAPQPSVKLGVLPFYLRERDANAISETYAWPFFGYAHRTAPYHFDEIRYFWPFLVQARGDDRYINRWGPIYTHSVIKGKDKTWILWPFWNQQRWTEDRLQHTTQQFFYFLYNSNEQRSATNPSLPSARRIHFWPFASIWYNGAGRKQIQAFSPLELFFPYNPSIKLSYSPLFAFCRYDQKSPDEKHFSLFWDLVTYNRKAVQKEFHFGPLLSIESHQAQKRVALGSGLLGWERRPNGIGWRLFAFEFKRRPPPPVRETTPP